MSEERKKPLFEALTREAYGMVQRVTLFIAPYLQQVSDSPHMQYSPGFLNAKVATVHNEFTRTL
jgi:hypothetical protein